MNRDDTRIRWLIDRAIEAGADAAQAQRVLELLRPTLTDEQKRLLTDAGFWKED